MDSGLPLTIQSVAKDLPSKRGRKGFVNIYNQQAHGFKELVKWQRESAKQGKSVINPTEVVDFPLLRPPVEWLQHNRRETTITWLGHATFLLQRSGLNILTDPHLSGRASPLSWVGPKRYVDAAMKAEELPALDVILISHNHYDHLDLTTIQELKVAGKIHEYTRIFVPLGLKDWFSRQGLPGAIELNWWEQSPVQSLQVMAVPAEHFSGRGLHDRNFTLWCGFVLSWGASPSNLEKTEHSNLEKTERWYFAGDTGYSLIFPEIGKLLGPFELCMIPIGAYDPRWFMRPVHVDPEEAVQMHLDLRSEFSIGMHWGTFKLTDEPLHEPPERLRQACLNQSLPDNAFITCAHGATLRQRSGKFLPYLESPVLEKIN